MPVHSVDLDFLLLKLNSLWKQDSELQNSAFQLSTLSLHLYPILQSTNQTLWELLERGAGAGTVVIALEQQAGKGQWGRQWQSSRGGLYLSFALSPDWPVDCAAQLTQAIAWGIAMTLQTYRVPVRLKWPNDLILEGQKLGGILTETRIQRGRIHQAVVGVGINWQNAVPDTGINLYSYGQQQVESTIDSLEALAALTLAGITLGATALQTKPTDVLLREYLGFLVNLGQKIILDDQVGTIVGVAPTGELLVQVGARPSPKADSLKTELEDLTTLISLKPGTISLGYGSTG